MSTKTEQSSGRYEIGNLIAKLMQKIYADMKLGIVLRIWNQKSRPITWLYGDKKESEYGTLKLHPVRPACCRLSSPQRSHCQEPVSPTPHT